MPIVAAYEFVSFCDVYDPEVFSSLLFLIDLTLVNGITISDRGTVQKHVL